MTKGTRPYLARSVKGYYKQKADKMDHPWQKVVYLRETMHTYQAIGDYLGFSRQRAQQVYEQAVKKMEGEG